MPNPQNSPTPPNRQQLVQLRQAADSARQQRIRELMRDYDAQTYIPEMQRIAAICAAIGHQPATPVQDCEGSTRVSCQICGMLLSTPTPAEWDFE